VTPPEAVVSKKRHVSAIWLLPLLAFVIGAALVINLHLNRGPEIEILFPSAEGLEPGKTKIKALSVDVGTVQSVALTPGLDQVLVKARMEKVAEPLLHADTQFWIVRPRVASSGISGLGTLLSGVYIELSPGQSNESAYQFTGLPETPVTPQNIPGLRLVLVSEKGSSVNTGDPILYQGYKVGRVENSEFDVNSRQIRSHIFIEAPYHELVSRNTRFWNASGISFRADSQGVTVDTASVETLLIGGVAFDVPAGKPAGPRVTDGTQFTLYPNYSSITQVSFRYTARYLLLFDTSVRGLVQGAPVEYRGLRVGSVEDISFDYLPPNFAQTNTNPANRAAIPVLITLSPGFMSGKDTQEELDLMIRQLEEGVANGLRGSLKTGNLLTGSLFVSLDFVEDAPPAQIGQIGTYRQIPTVSGGLDLLQTKVANLLDKLNQLPVDKTISHVDTLLDNATDAMQRVEAVAQTLQALVESEELQNIPVLANELLTLLNKRLDELSASYSAESPLYQDLQQTVAHLQQTLRNLDELTVKIASNPSTLIFSDTQKPDPIPEP
jgi:paraquat-inducible protein B